MTRKLDFRKLLPQDIGDRKKKFDPSAGAEPDPYRACSICSQQSHPLDHRSTHHKCVRSALMVGSSIVPLPLVIHRSRTASLIIASAEKLEPQFPNYRITVFELFCLFREKRLKNNGQPSRKLKFFKHRLFHWPL
jgi:hypothetical protein